MTIKFSDETIRDAAYTANNTNGYETNGIRNDWRAAAAVFEAAANGQAMASWDIPVNDKDHPRFIAGYSAGLHDRALEQAAITEPTFVVGKRYRTRAAEAAKVIDLTPQGWVKALHADGMHLVTDAGGLVMGVDLPHALDLLPGALDDEPKSILADPNHSGCQTAEDYWKARAERAEAVIERARAGIEQSLHAEVNGEYQVWFQSGLHHASELLGLTITPARELTVTWEGGK